jgi:hypothetical protein
MGEYRPLGMITEAQFGAVFDVNVKGTLFTVQKALPLLQDGGAIVLTASLAASTGAAAMSVYNAAKAAVRSFARTWAVELSDRQIRVNAVSPGPIQTPGLDSVVPDDLKGAVAAHTLMNRFGEADEVARAVLFLASDESSYITGIELSVDGGSILHEREDESALVRNMDATCLDVGMDISPEGWIWPLPVSGVKARASNVQNMLSNGVGMALLTADQGCRPGRSTLRRY